MKLIDHDTSEPQKPCRSNEEWGYLEDNIWHFIPRIKNVLHFYKCFYRVVIRIDDFKYSFSDYFIINDLQNIQHDVIEVTCKDIRSKRLKHAIAYTGLFVQIVKKKYKKLSSQISNKTKPLNIILLSFDSVSRVSWLKRLKRTNELIFNQMKFELLKGYNIVGDGTPAGKI